MVPQPYEGTDAATRKSLTDNRILRNFDPFRVTVCYPIGEALGDSCGCGKRACPSQGFAVSERSGDLSAITSLATDRLLGRVGRILEREAAEPGLEPWEVEILRDLRAKAAALEDALEVWENHWAGRRDRRP